MNPCAIFIGIAIGLALAAAFVALVMYDGDEEKVRRRWENKRRLDFARKAGYLVYSYEDADGSKSWRRVSSD